MARKLKPVKKDKYRFSLEDAKIYLSAVIILFHIIPMIISFFGETGQSILTNMFMMILNPIFIFVVCCFYGARYGFEWKFPLIAGLLAAASIMMYYKFAGINYFIASSLIYLIVYIIFAYAFTYTGGFIKRLMGGV
ncbi:MAG: hypothetical protein PUF72_10875 [Clostridiales bacterium]|nr:hypothetical protein [Clostridiales bacterium]